MDIMSDCGCNFNEGTAAYACTFAKNCYSSQAWKFHPYLVRTDTPSNTYCRAPGTTQGIAIVENLMEHLAKACNEDPLAFRLKNLTNQSDEADAMRNIISEVRRSSEYDQRVEQVS
jgi:xanthine dehydrogenase/oxidase